MCKRSWKKACCLNANSLLRASSSWTNELSSWLIDPRASSFESFDCWKLKDPFEYASLHFPGLSSGLVTTFCLPPYTNGDSTCTKISNTLNTTCWLYNTQDDYNFGNLIWLNLNVNQHPWKEMYSIQFSVILGFHQDLTLNYYIEFFT